MRIRAVLALAAALLLVSPGVAAAADLHDPHEGTIVQCDGDVRWHFVHNQVAEGTTTTGTLTATFEGAGTVTVDAYKVLRSVRHYEVITSGDTLLSASDDIVEGSLVLSDAECLGETPPPPPTECVAGDTVTVTWDARLGWPFNGDLVETDSATTSLLPGSYSVTLTSTDLAHPQLTQLHQDEEQWYVNLYLGGMLVATTGAIDDLGEYDTVLTQNVGTITLTDGADLAVATHLLTDARPFDQWGSLESIEPTSAVFTCL